MTIKKCIACWEMNESLVSYCIQCRNCYLCVSCEQELEKQYTPLNAPCPNCRYVREHRFVQYAKVLRAIYISQRVMLDGNQLWWCHSKRSCYSDWIQDLDHLVFLVYYVALIISWRLPYSMGVTEILINGIYMGSLLSLLFMTMPF